MGVFDKFLDIMKLNDDDYDDDEVYTLKCDNCGEEIDFTADDLDDLASGDFVCPECGNTIELEFDECDCDCDDCH